MTGDGVTLVGDARGNPEAQAVLLLHGGGQTRHAWGGTAEALAGAGFYAVALDQRGHGESDWAKDGDYRLERFAADIRAVVTELGAPPTLVGASLGGLAALLAEGESERPELRSLVLVDVGPRLDATGVDRVIGFMKEKIDEGFATLDEAADAIAAYLPHRPRPSDTSGLSKNLRLGEDGRYRWHWDPKFMSGERHTNATSMTDRLLDASRRLTIPTLLVRGRMSDVLSEEAAREFLELVPHAELADVRGASHMVAGDRNDVFTDAVVGFLAC